MPSFAKNDKPVTGATEILMEDVFASGQSEVLLNQMRQAARQRAKTILQTELPAYIAHLDELLEQQSKDHTSPLWEGHLQSNPFVKENVKLLLSKGDVKKKDGSEAGSQVSDELPGKDGMDSSQKLSTKSEEDFGGDGDENTSATCWKGQMPPNEVCDRLADLVQKEANQAVVLAQGLTRWLRLEVPTIEDGNNFGVEASPWSDSPCVILIAHPFHQVQDKLLRTLQHFRSASWENQTAPKNRHYADRRALAMSWCRYPNLEDHAGAIAFGDRHWFHMARLILETQRTIALGVLDGLRKNWTRVHDPKDKKGGNGRAAMY